MKLSRFVLTIPLFLCFVFSSEDWIYIVGVHNGKGIIANLSLKILPGNGNVYISTSPLTKVDTQASARVAVRVACEIFNVNCSRYDFLFRIEGRGEIVGGPSAGAAMTVLAMGLLSNTTLRKDIIMTGTINPDWSIGPVGGIKEKYLAAKEYASLFLIPYGEKTEEIESIEEKTKIIEVKDALDAYKYFTEREIQIKIQKINLTQINNLIKKAEVMVCKKAKSFEYLAKKPSDLLKKARELEKKGKYYSAASYCVRAIKELYTKYLEENIENIENEVQEMRNEIKNLSKKRLTYDPNSLELVFIFLDRLYEANESLNEGVESRDIEKIAGAKARIISAEAWLSLIPPGKWVFDEDQYIGCSRDAIERAEIGVIYASTYYTGGPVAEAKSKIEKARELLERGKAVRALFLSKEAEVLSELALENLEDKEKVFEKYQELLDKRIRFYVSQNYYPILALLYKEYSSVLWEEDKNAAIYFAKLALKMSSLPSEIKHTKLSPKIIEVRKETAKKLLTIPLALLLFLCFLGVLIYLGKI